MTESKGQCLCGEIRFKVDVRDNHAGLCYCKICRHWSAGPLVMIHGDAAPEVENPQMLGVYQSSEWGERCFCKQCGTSLFWRKVGGGFYGIAVDALENSDSISLGSEIFIDQIPRYYQQTDQTRRMTASEFWKMVEEMGG